jgi:hypothetical protein
MLVGNLSITFASVVFKSEKGDVPPASSWHLGVYDDDGSS